MNTTRLINQRNVRWRILALAAATVASAWAAPDTEVKLASVAEPPQTTVVRSTGEQGEAVQYRYWDPEENCISQAQSFLWDSDRPLVTLGLFLDPAQADHPWATGATQKYKLQIREADDRSMAAGDVVKEFEFAIGEQNIGSGGNWLTISFPPVPLTRGRWYSFQLFPAEMKDGQRILTGRNSGGYDGIWGFCRGEKQQPFTSGLEDRGDDLTFFLEAAR